MSSSDWEINLLFSEGVGQRRASLPYIGWMEILAPRPASFHPVALDLEWDDPRMDPQGLASMAHSHDIMLNLLC